MTKRHTQHMFRDAFDLAVDYFSVHQADMEPHELVEATHLLHELAKAFVKSETWAQKRRAKLGIPETTTAVPIRDDEDDTPPSASHQSERNGPVTLGSLEDVLADFSAFGPLKDPSEPPTDPLGGYEEPLAEPALPGAAPKAAPRAAIPAAPKAAPIPVRAPVAAPTSRPIAAGLQKPTAPRTTSAPVTLARVKLPTPPASIPIPVAAPKQNGHHVRREFASVS